MNENKKFTILIVDDSSIIIKRVTGIIKDLNNTGTILHASNFVKALQLVNQSTPQIVLLDIHLPDKSGVELLRHIKKNQLPITVIMFTNQSEEYYKTLCREIGADYFIDKSSGFEEIPGIINSLP
jgi:DNA-binding NarL/FixJ family response regulator